MLDVVVIGHIAIDRNVLPWGTVENVLGGAPTYAGMALKTLKKNVGLVSKVGRDFEDFSFYTKHGIDIKGVSIGGLLTTRFENIYDIDGERKQICKCGVSHITSDDIPELYRKARSFYISPITNEVEVELIKQLKREDNIIMLDPQGLFRKITENGRVEIALREDFKDFLKYVDIIKIGKSEASVFGIGVEKILSYLICAGPKIAIVTLGNKGCMFSVGDKIETVHCLKVDAKDFTGAGDVFGATFLATYMDTLNVRESIKSASIAAGLKIRHMGPDGFPSKEEIEEVKGLIDLTP